VLTAVLRPKRLNGGVPEGQTGGGVGIYRRTLGEKGFLFYISAVLSYFGRGRHVACC